MDTLRQRDHTQLREAPVRECLEEELRVREVTMQRSGKRASPAAGAGRQRGGYRGLCKVVCSWWLLPRSSHKESAVGLGLLLAGGVRSWEEELDLRQGKAKTNWNPRAPLRLSLTSFNP